MQSVIKKIITGEHIVLLLLFSLLLNGCSVIKNTAGIKTAAQNFYISDRRVLLDIPFVKQKKSYCGPAALEAVFKYWDNVPKAEYVQENIAGKIFYPQLCGVLNIDLEQYAKDQGFWAKGYTTDFDRIKSRLKAGIPVIVIEKLHPYLLNRLHYTIIVGFDETAKIVFEHNGKRAFIKRSYRGFLRNWSAGGNWMLEIFPADRIPADFDQRNFFELAVWLEKKNHNDLALEYYQKVNNLKEKTEKPAALFNSGNIYFKKQEYKKAAEEYLKAIELDTSFADSYNNLAFTYLKLGDLEQAQAFIKKALALSSDKKFYYLDTQAQIFWQENDVSSVCNILKLIILEKNKISPQIWNKFALFWQKRFKEKKVSHLIPQLN